MSRPRQWGFGLIRAPFGLGIGDLVLLPPVIAQPEFEPADIARIVALVTAINQAVFAFASFAFGVLHTDRQLSVAFSAVVAFQLVAGVIVLTGREVLNPYCAHILRGSK